MQEHSPQGWSSPSASFVTSWWPCFYNFGSPIKMLDFWIQHTKIPGITAVLGVYWTENIGNSGELSDSKQVVDGDACITYKEEVKQGNKALQCHFCKVWEHLRCMKVCDRPTNECYTALTHFLWKSSIFACTKFRRKGTLVWRLVHAKLSLKTINRRNSWKRSSNRLSLSIEHDELKIKKEWLESQLDPVKLESTATATTTTPDYRALADNVASGRRILPQLPVTIYTTSSWHGEWI